MDIARLGDKLHPLERKVLPLVQKSHTLDALMKESALSEIEVMRALQWLQNKGLLTLTQQNEQLIVLGTNGTAYRTKGLPEKRFLLAISGEMSVKDAAGKAGLSEEEIHITLGVLKRKAAVTIRKAKDLMVSQTKQGTELSKKKSFEEQFLGREFPVSEAELGDTERFAFAELRKRKDIVRLQDIRSVTTELTNLGKKVIESGIRETGTLERLTPAMLKTGSWKNAGFRSYDVEINVPKIYGGKRHFVDQSVEDIKRIWLDLGFREMKGQIVQTSFWDLDVLFVPQDHPARDMQDTFYIKDPKYGKLPQELTAKIKAVHENGGKTGSTGWGYSWSEEKAKENLLRTHTTVLSAQTIAKLRNEDLPAKFFSVKRVYRNETLSWKALFEFVQVEGIVVDPDANFKHLKGYLINFFRKMGFPDVRIRPGHFPYTEPSAEVDVWHPGKNRWVELGGSGIFRPEVVQPLLGKQIPVLAWGIGMERSIMEYYKITDIRDLYKNDLKQLREMKVWMANTPVK
jgi:phenylalanyl-tRNA synthetase alpha chain